MSVSVDSLVDVWTNPVDIEKWHWQEKFEHHINIKRDAFRKRNQKKSSHSNLVNNVDL